MKFKPIGANEVSALKNSIINSKIFTIIYVEILQNKMCGILTKVVL